MDYAVYKIVAIVIVNCPRCSKAYSLTPEILASPQLITDKGAPLSGWWLSCGICSHAWWHSAQQQPLSVDPKLAPLTTQPLLMGVPLARQNNDFSVRFKRSSWWLSVISGLIIVLSLAGVGYLYKQPLLLLWERIVSSSATPVLQPLNLHNVSYTLSPSTSTPDDSQVLTVTGEIINPNPVILATPLLRISVWVDCQESPQATASPRGDCLYLEWIYKPNITQMGGGTALQFETSYPISASVRRVEVAIP